MRKCEITVWDYSGDFFGGGGKEAPPTSYEVEANCVAGETGILAFFFLNKWLCIARGDDGSWQLIYTCNKAWAGEVREAVEGL